MEARSDTRPAIPNPLPLSVDDVKDRLARGEPLTFIDARNPITWGSSRARLPGAIRVAVDDVERHLPSLPRDRRLVVYCT